jgi:hypothetical protein
MMRICAVLGMSALGSNPSTNPSACSVARESSISRQMT